jgi:hypothetical protein
METPSPLTSIQKLFAVSLALITWISVGLQLELMTGTVTNFFSYFTIQCNLLIAISLTFASLVPQSAPGKFFSQLSVQTAIALYIFIVALVYNVVLRKLHHWEGLQWWVDNMLHVVIPLLYLMYWFLYRSSGVIARKDSVNWIFFPAAYLVYTLIRGSMVEWYPYPFLNAINLGYEQVLLNIAIMLSIFLVAGVILIAFTRTLKSD